MRRSITDRLADVAASGGIPGPPATDGHRTSAGLGARAVILVALALVAGGITWLFLGMRRLMSVGGACAEGGPYAVRQPCPTGTTGLVLFGILAATAGAVVYVLLTLRHRLPSLWWTFWPGLFMSLGVNFLQYGLSPPPPRTGIEMAWVAPGVMFEIMGAVPLVAAVLLIARRRRAPRLRDRLKTLAKERATGALTGEEHAAEKRRVKAAEASLQADDNLLSNPLGVRPRARAGRWLVAQIPAIAAGILVGWWLAS